MKTAATMIFFVMILCGGHVPAQDLPGDTGAPRKPGPATFPSAEERLGRLEEQLAAMLEEVRALRKEAKSGGLKPKGAEPSGDPAMQPGMLAKSYVRTGQADAASPPPPKATPSDERHNSSPSFNAVAVARAAGYEQGTSVTVVWEGFFKVEESDNYEFIIQSRYYGVSGILEVDSQVITTHKGENSVRIKLDKGYWPIKLTSPAIYSGELEVKVKRSGFDPVPLLPGGLWTPKNAE